MGIAGCCDEIFLSVSSFFFVFVLNFFCWGIAGCCEAGCRRHARGHSPPPPPPIVCWRCRQRVSPAAQAGASGLLRRKQTQAVCRGASRRKRFVAAQADASGLLRRKQAQAVCRGASRRKRFAAAQAGASGLPAGHSPLPRLAGGAGRTFCLLAARAKPFSRAI